MRSLFTIHMIDYRNGASPACGSRRYFHWKADDGEVLGRQFVEVGQFLQVAVSDVAACLMPLPDNRGISTLCETSSRRRERCVPTPAVGTRDSHALFKQV